MAPTTPPTEEERLQAELAWLRALRRHLQARRQELEAELGLEEKLPDLKLVKS
jgi:hypothetical protein